MTPGDHIAGWTARAPLGSGGGGEVWLSDHADGRVGALKVLSATASHEDRARLVREMRSLERLDHPAIVRLLDCGFETPTRPWLVMEYVEGQDLEQRLAGGAPLAPEACLSLFAVLADGLAHAHERGIQHRDVKASNVILRRDGRLTIVDFGAAIESDATGVTKAGLVLGSFAYMPPEVLTGGTRDPVLGDVYALGQLLLEALTGALWFRGSADGRSSWHDVVADKLQYDTLDPGDAFPDRLRRVVQHATALEPEDRIPSMRALRDHLDAILTGTYATPAPAYHADERAPLAAGPGRWPRADAPPPRTASPPAGVSPIARIAIALAVGALTAALLSLVV